MDKNSVEEKKNFLINGFSASSISIFIATITAVGALLGAAIGAYATVSSAQKTREESCIKRVDEREMLTRKKAEVLLGSMGGFLGSIGTSKEIPTEPGRVVMQSAFKLTAYAPLELNVVALKISAAIYLGLTARTPEQQENAVLAASESFKGWNENYIKLMKSFDAERKQCAQR